MERQNVSVIVPLLENPSSRNQPAYLKTGFFDTFLMFWVGKIVDVFLSILSCLFSTQKFRLETAKHSNKICIGIFVSKSLQASWLTILLKNSAKINIKENHYSEPLCPPPKVLVLSRF